MPYTVTASFPNSGKAEGGTEVLIIGSGFVERDGFAPRCRFGTPTNYKIVEAQVISYNKMVCISPPVIDFKPTQDLPLEVPFSVALTQDEFEPFTETHHRFRYYNVPKITTIDPIEVDVGFITEIQVRIDEKKAKKGHLFFEPQPAALGRWDIANHMGDEASAQASALLMDNTIKCRFGRFGETAAVFINETAVKCLTPSLLENPEDIYRETVVFSLSMNGYDYPYEHNSFDFTFIGTANWISMGPIVLGILMFGAVIVAFVWCVHNWAQYNMSFHQQNAAPNTQIYGNAVEQRNWLRSNQRSA